MRFSIQSGFNNGDQLYSYLKAAFDQLYSEGDVSPKMMSVGLHCRIIGRPSRAHALARFLDYILQFDDVWICRRADIARHWHKYHAPRS